jgi:hypothetical protein
MLGTVLLILLILMLVGALPTWHEWGYGPSGGVGVVLLIIIVLILAGRL